jgi:hypothetical protein
MNHNKAYSKLYRVYEYRYSLELMGGGDLVDAGAVTRLDKLNDAYLAIASDERDARRLKLLWMNNYVGFVGFFLYCIFEKHWQFFLFNLFSFLYCFSCFLLF